MRQLERDRLGHAPLIQGLQGTGKQFLAEELVRAVLCQASNVPLRQGCGQCKSCLLLANGTHPDFFSVRPEEESRQITVDQIRRLNDQLLLTPAIGQTRVGLISPADVMNKNAANALLKTLEEPFSNVWIVLISSAPQRLLSTIRSRCQKVLVRPPNRIEAKQWLASLFPDSEDVEVEVALGLSSGGPLLAAEQIKNGVVKTAFDVLGQLTELASGQAPRPGLERDWAEDPALSWSILNFWLGELALAAHRPNSVAALVPLAEKAFGRNLDHLWRDTVEGVSFSERPYRHDLSFTQWLLRWREAFQ